MNCFEILGIEKTEEIKKIKRAYAEKSKEYHPEEYPDEFQVLHDAYEAALKWAKEVKALRELGEVEEIPTHAPLIKNTISEEEGERLSNIQMSDEEEVFGLTVGPVERAADEVFRFIQECREIYANEIDREMLSLWKDAFKNAKASGIIHTKEFVEVWYGFLGGHSMFTTRVWKYLESLDGVEFNSEEFAIPKFDYERYKDLSKSRKKVHEKKVEKQDDAAFWRWIKTGKKYETDPVVTPVHKRIVWVIAALLLSVICGEVLGDILIGILEFFL